MDTPAATHQAVAYALSKGLFLHHLKPQRTLSSDAHATQQREHLCDRKPLGFRNFE